MARASPSADARLIAKIDTSVISPSTRITNVVPTMDKIPIPTGIRAATNPRKIRNNAMNVSGIAMTSDLTRSCFAMSSVSASNTA